MCDTGPFGMRSPLFVYEAGNSPGEPMCVSGGDATDEGLHLNLYLDENDVVRGVEVWEDNLLALVGEIPPEAIAADPAAYEQFEQFEQESSARTVDVRTRTETGLLTENGQSWEFETRFERV